MTAVAILVLGIVSVTLEAYVPRNRHREPFTKRDRAIGTRPQPFDEESTAVIGHGLPWFIELRETRKNNGNGAPSHNPGGARPAHPGTVASQHRSAMVPDIFPEALGL